MLPLRLGFQADEEDEAPRGGPAAAKRGLAVFVASSVREHVGSIASFKRKCPAQSTGSGLQSYGALDSVQDVPMSEEL